ncbi:MAG: glutamate--tRNA ligase [Crenarchaeota archaeon]|nr:glutamate--tRNA ligase [Thermoproteota archaeon]
MSSPCLSESDKELVKRIALRYALENALRYGKARLGPVVNKVLGEVKDLRRCAKEVAQVVKEVVEEINGLSPDELRRKASELGISEEKRKEEKKGLPPLPNVEMWGYVKTRFAPNPDFVIHLGNARAAILSHEYARMYNGKFVLRFEDTDPRIKTPIPEAYRAIEEDLEWLGIRWDEEYIQSLRMELYYDVIRKLLEEGKAYVDLCPADVFRKFRNEGKPCPHREEDPATQLERFDKMLEGCYGEGEAVIRIKTDLTHPDPAVRDWVAFRVIDTSRNPHPITGDRYVVWPTYNFAAAVDDHVLGVTHILRGREHAVNTIKQMYVYRHMGWRYPEVINFGRVSIEGFILSKSRIKELLKRYRRMFLGYDDPRFGTIASLRRRGILPETIRELILELGVKGTDATVSWENIASLNRKIGDRKCKRVFVVLNPVRVVLTNLETPLQVRIRFHPSENLGERQYLLSRPEIVISRDDAEHLRSKGGLRLMEFANIEYIEEKNNSIVAKVVKGGVEVAKAKGYRIVQWIPVEHAVRVTIYEASGKRLRKRRAVGESILRNLVGEVVQMIRVGFGRIDSAVGNSVDVIYAHS